MIAEHSAELVSQLAYLRRYARLLLGSQSRGDRYVRVYLEILLEEANGLPPGPSLRARLFRSFHDVWDRISSGIDLTPDPQGLHGNTALEAHIQSLPSAGRRVLLLTAAEGFSVPDTGYILDMDQREIDRLLMEAQRSLRDQAATTVLVIEDEPVIALDIARIVEEMGHTVVAMATTREEAVDLARTKRPGIVLADIQLDDGSSGVDAVNEILKSIDVPVVFVTAFPERLLTGEKREPTFLVTKPFDTDVLKVTMYQALLAVGQPASRKA